MNLVAAILLLLFSSGRWIVPLAAWLSPIFLLRFVRNGPALPRLLVAIVVVYAVGCFTYRGVVPVPGAAYFGIMAAIMVPTVFPYIAGRLVRRSGGFAQTLVFPSAWVLTEWFVSRTSPYGSWGSVAYTQVDCLPLVQSVSVTGLWGIAFLVAWMASIVNWAWERGFEWQRVGGAVLTGAGTLSLVLLLGGARLVFDPPRGPTIRVASFTIPPPAALKPWELMRHAREGAALDTLTDQLESHYLELFEAVEREASAGARLVMWSEVGAFVLKSREQDFERSASALAQQLGIHLVMGLAVFTPGEGYYENILLAIDSTGTRVARYHKARPVPGDPERGADKVIPVFESGLGKIAGAVCFDGDFPDLIVKAGKSRAGLLLIPSSDWREIDPIHTRMALLRGVENGCSVVRQTNQGLSSAADWQGRVLAETDFFRTTPCVMVAQVPVRGVRTLYSVLPDLLPLLCGFVVGFSAAGGVLNRRR